MAKILLTVAAVLISLSSQASFSLSTQNLWHYTTDYETRLQNLNTSFDTDQADIMNFQEAWKSIGGKSLYNEILNKGDFQSHFVRTNNTVIIKEGLATISKFPQDDKKFNFKLPHSKVFRRRTMLVTKVKLPSQKEVYIANIHLSPFEEGRSDRDDQLLFILKILKNDFSHLPIIITGDFNQEEDKSFFTPLIAAGFSSSLEGLCTYCGNENPYAKSEYVSKLDYIFYQKSYFDLIDARRIFVNNPISDHYGLRVEFKDLRD